jgi:schlafen family protein
MTDEEIRNLILLKSEGPNLDYKAGFPWTKDNRDKKYEIIRDLIALSNTKDGGCVIFGVRDEDLSFIGVSSDVYESADPSSVLQMLYDNAAPKACCAIFKREIDGKRVVVFDVAEFDETPTICTNTILSSDGAKRTILREGAVYVRTGAATTEEISTADDMRSLISRAVKRKSDDLLRSIRDLLTGKPASVGAESATEFAKEAREAEEFFDSKLGDALKSGHFEVLTHPTIHDPKRIQSHLEVKEALRASEVALKGWNFPHTDKENSGPFGRGFQSATIWDRYVEGFRLYQSGLFLWRRAY